METTAGNVSFKYVCGCNIFDKDELHIMLN